MSSNKELIGDAVSVLNDSYNTTIDANMFFDDICSSFCTSSFKDNVLNLSFPVVATRDFAEVSMKLMEDSTFSITYNKPFELEIKRLSSS